MLLRLVFLLALFSPFVWTIRCQCSVDSKDVRCYNQWCEAPDYGGKVGACAVVQKGSRRIFACVRIHESSEDSCKVDRVNGQDQVRCWCRSGDYCNIDLADRVEDGDYDIRARPMARTTTTTLPPPTTTRDDFVIEQTYDVIGDESLVESIDAISRDWEREPLPKPPSREKLPPLDPWPQTTRRPSTNRTTIPPWRREVPLPPDPDQIRIPNPFEPRIPPRPPGNLNSMLPDSSSRIWYPPPQRPTTTTERPVYPPYYWTTATSALPRTISWPTTSTTTITTTRKPITTTSTTTTTTTTTTTRPPITTTQYIELPSFRLYKPNRVSNTLEETYRQYPSNYYGRPISKVTTTTTTTTTPAPATTSTMSVRDIAIKSYKENQVRFKAVDSGASKSYIKMKEGHRPPKATSTTTTTSTAIPTTTTTTSTTSTTTTSAATMSSTTSTTAIPKKPLLEGAIDVKAPNPKLKSIKISSSSSTTTTSTRPPRRKISKVRQELYDSITKEPSSGFQISVITSFLIIYVLHFFQFFN